MKKFFFLWIYSAVAVTFLCLLVYMVAQQSFRQNLNDPQLQMAEDAAAKLIPDSGVADALALVPSGQIQIDKSLASWMVVYGQDLEPLAGSGMLWGDYARPPKSLFDTSTWRPHKTYDINGMPETRVTWQPESGVREALILVRAPNGMWVGAGRNMREIEGRIIDVGIKIFLGWLVILGALFVASFAGWWVLKK